MDDINKCYLCNRNYPHRRVCLGDDNGLRIIEIITNCPSCRALLRRQKEVYEELDKIKQKIENIYLGKVI